MRRLARLVIVLLVLALLLVAGVQAFLWWSDLPRRLVVAELEDLTGLSVELDALTVGWSGRTQLRGLRVAPPLHGEPVLEAEHVRVRHTMLPLLVLTGSLTLHELAVDEPTLHARRDEAGQWDVARVIDAVRGAQRRRAEPPEPGPIELPAIDVRGATLLLSVHDEPTLELGDLSVQGRHGRALGYTFDVDAGPVGTLTATLARSAPFAHEVEFDVQAPPALIELFGQRVTVTEPGPAPPLYRRALARSVPAELFDPFDGLVAHGPAPEGESAFGARAGSARASQAAPARQTLTAPDESLPAEARYSARGRWRGRFEEAGPSGELTLSTANVPGLGRVEGALALRHRLADAATIIRPRPVIAFTPAVGFDQTVELTGGELMWREGQLTKRDLRLVGLGGEVQVNGQFDPEQRIGQLSAAWRRLTLPTGFVHEGRLELTVQREGPAHRRLEAHTRFTTDSPLGQWRGRTELEATGRDWRNLTASVTTRQLELDHDDAVYALPDLTAEVSVAAPLVRLTSVRVHEPEPGQRLAATGYLDWQQRDWMLTVAGEQLPVPGMPDPQARLGTLRIEAAGDRQQIRLRQARLSGGGVVASATGGYVPGADEPLTLDLELREAPIQVGDEAHLWIDADNLLGNLRLAGTLQPVALRADGELVARRLRIYQEPVGDLTLAVRADVDAQRVAARASVGEWLGGDWRIESRFAYGDRPGIIIEGRGIDLAAIDRMLGQDLALDGQADLRLVTAAPEAPDALQPIEGTFELRDVVRAPVRADRITGRIDLVGERLRIHDIEGRRADGRLGGGLALNLDEPSRIELDTTLTDWPLLLEDRQLQLLLDARADGAVDVAERSGEGTLELRTRARFEDRALMDLQWSAGLDESVLALDDVEGTLLEGSVTGRGRLDLHTPTHAELVIRWNEVAPMLLRPVTPRAADFEGTVDGSLIVGPTDHRRAIGPVRLDLELTESDATYRRLPIGTGRLTAYLDPERQRYVLHESSLEVAGGTASLWGRLSWRDFGAFGPHRGGWYAFVQGEIADMDLGAVTRELRPDAEPFFGRFTGEATLSTPLHDWSQAFGRGQFTLRESDIAHVPIFSVLYDVMNVRFLDPSPDGDGEVRVRVDGGDLVFDRFRYANRGTHFELAGRVSDLWAGGEGTIEGVAAVSVSPLPDILLLDWINQALALFQTDVTTARIDGTVAEPRVRVVPFRGIQRTLQSVVVGGRYEAPETEFEAEDEIEFRPEILDPEADEDAADQSDADDGHNDDENDVEDDVEDGAAAS